LGSESNYTTNRKQTQTARLLIAFAVFFASAKDFSKERQLHFGHKTYNNKNLEILAKSNSVLNAKGVNKNVTIPQNIQVVFSINLS